MKTSWKYSIRHRIMLIFVGLMAAMLLAIWAVNNWWLEKYYIDEKRKEMEAAYDDIDVAVLEKTRNGESIGQVIARELQEEWDDWSHPGGIRQEEPETSEKSRQENGGILEEGDSGSGEVSGERNSGSGGISEKRVSGVGEISEGKASGNSEISKGEAPGAREFSEEEAPGSGKIPEEEVSESRGISERENPGTGDVMGERQPEERYEQTLVELIRDYGDKNNINMVLIDSNTGATILGAGRDSDYLVQKVQRYVLGIEGKHAITLKEHENYVVETNYDFRSRSSYMESWGFLSDNRTIFIMSMPLASIRESVELTNRFMTYVGLSALVLGSILMYFVTRRVTNPLLRLAALSERMSELDFDAKYEENSRDEIGVLGRSMNTLSDKLKETIGALQDANQKLQHDIEEKIQIDEMRKEFIANVSHELKTPIALIQGYAEGLGEGMCEDKESRDYYCEVITDEAGKMNKMVKQLLTLSALESGGDTPVPERFDIHELIRDLLNSARILIEQKKAQVIFEPEGACYVRADEFKIEEVVTNYLNNALNHLGGERQIRICTKMQTDQVLVQVYNTGEPIPKEDIPNLWTKFYKVDKARTRSYGGSGIGLSIVKAIMDAHHQSCGVENTEGGVEFWFTLERWREEGHSHI